MVSTRQNKRDNNTHYSPLKHSDRTRRCTAHLKESNMVYWWKTIRSRKAWIWKKPWPAPWPLWLWDDEGTFSATLDSHLAELLFFCIAKSFNLQEQESRSAQPSPVYCIDDLAMNDTAANLPSSHADNGLVSCLGCALETYCEAKHIWNYGTVGKEYARISS